MNASSTPGGRPPAPRRAALAIALALGTALAGCDRKPTDPPKPSTALSLPAAAGDIAAPSRG